MGLMMNIAKGEVPAIEIAQKPLLLSVFTNAKVRAQKQTQKHTKTDKNTHA
jgi:hypothetical protein